MTNKKDTEFKASDDDSEFKYKGSQRAHKYEIMLADLCNYIMYDLPPGPKCLDLHVVINT